MRMSVEVKSDRERKVAKPLAFTSSAIIDTRWWIYCLSMINYTVWSTDALAKHVVYWYWEYSSLKTDLTSVRREKRSENCNRVVGMIAGINCNRRVSVKISDESDLWQNRVLHRQSRFNDMLNLGQYFYDQRSILRWSLEFFFRHAFPDINITLSFSMFSAYTAVLILIVSVYK